MDSRTPSPVLHVALAIIGGIIMAFFLGQAAAQGSYSKIGAILALGPVLFIVLGLQGRVWLLIPFSGAFYGSIPLLPLPFAVSEVVKLAAFGVFLCLAIFKKLPKRTNFDGLDFLLFLNLLYLVTVFLRNPVGVNALGSERVGGRPYYMVIIACMLYWVYLRISVGPRLGFYLPIISLAGAFVAFMIWLVSYVVPGAAQFISKFYTGVDFGLLLAEYREGPASEETFSRLGAMGNFGFAAVCLLIAYFRPLTLLSPVYFWRFCAFAMSSLAMMMGGFRSKLFTAGLYFLGISYLRGGLIDTIRAAILGLMAVLILLGIQMSGVLPIPLAIQRTLSAIPIPVDWDYSVVSDARGSSEWRFEMWREILTEDKWIENKFLGDGFGFTRAQLAMMQAEMLGTGGFIDGSESESQKIQGAYHNGPLSAIRYVGVVGLILYLILAFTLAFKSLKLVRRSMGTPYQPWGFLQIPTFFSPFLFIFVFGQYDSSLPITIASLASYKLLSRSLDDYLATKTKLIKSESVSATEEMEFALAHQRPV